MSDYEDEADNIQSGIDEGVADIPPDDPAPLEARDLLAWAKEIITMSKNQRHFTRIVSSGFANSQTTNDRADEKDRLLEEEDRWLEEYRGRQ